MADVPRPTRVVYKGHELCRDADDPRYWIYRPLKGSGGVSGNVYSSLKQTKKVIDIRLRRGEGG